MKSLKFFSLLALALSMFSIGVAFFVYGQQKQISQQAGYSVNVCEEQLTILNHTRADLNRFMEYYDNLNTMAKVENSIPLADRLQNKFYDTKIYFARLRDQARIGLQNDADAMQDFYPPATVSALQAFVNLTESTKWETVNQLPATLKFKNMAKAITQQMRSAIQTRSSSCLLY